jgi:hypothetical protein
MDGFAQQLDVMLFEPLVEELRGDLDRQNFVLKSNWLDGVKPRFERLTADVVFDNI